MTRKIPFIVAIVLITSFAVAASILILLSANYSALEVSTIVTLIKK